MLQAALASQVRLAGVPKARLLPAAIALHSRRGLSSEADPLKTCLYDFHVDNGGKMVNFAGYSMPVEYAGLAHIPSHLHTRKNCSIFDVSHMLQSRVHGKDRFDFIDSLTVADVRRLKLNTGSLTVFTNQNGGIEDDLIVTNAEDHLYVVSNAGCRDKDMVIMSNKIQEMQASGKDVAIEYINDRGLIAVQGPTMMECLQPLTNIDLKKLGFMSSQMGTVAGIENCRITRCGYTGEDGVEISIPDTSAPQITQTILASSGDPKLAGLGARDSLRLEAGLCLYGNDIDETTTPVEANLAWTIAKTRREAEGFPGDSIILGQLKEKPARKRVGFVSRGPPVRGHALITDNQGTKIGEITSGCPAPSMPKGTNISMGYVSKQAWKAGSEVNIVVRNKPVPAVVTKMPFVPTNYYSV